MWRLGVRVVKGDVWGRDVCVGRGRSVCGCVGACVCVYMGGRSVGGERCACQKGVRACVGRFENVKEALRV